MASFKNEAYGTLASVLTTTLNSMADNARVLSSAIDNSTDLHLYDDLELVVPAFASAPTAGKTVDVYLLASVDGTNYPTGDATDAPASGSYVGSFSLCNLTAQRQFLLNVPIPPGLFKYLLTNKAGQAMGSSSNTFKRRPHSHAVV